MTSSAVCATVATASGTQRETCDRPITTKTVTLGQ